MPGISNLTNVWNNIKEIDLRPLQQEALQVVKIALVGAPGAGRHTLADAMRRDPAQPGQATQTPLQILDLDAPVAAAAADLVVLVMSAQAGDFAREQSLTRELANAGKNVLVLVNQIPGAVASQGPWVEWGQKRVVYGSALDPEFLLKEFAPAVIDLLPDQLLSLGRHFPLFRTPIAHQLINDTSMSNATYSLSTGVAEVVPVLNIPLNATDMVMLTKSQAFLVYKLGLALGMSLHWQEYVAEFGGVLGGGFLWRQIARSLVGLIPAWGIIPKVAVAYSGTYVVGNAILQWYLTGRHISAHQMRALYRQAFARGKNLARGLAARAPRLKLPRPKLPALPAPKEKTAKAPRARRVPRGKQLCASCGKLNSKTAHYCDACGQPLLAAQPALPPGNGG